MIDDTLHCLAGGGTQLLRALPLLGGLFSGRPRLDLDGRVVFITGAARGLGAEIARQAHARGAQVALVGRRLDPLRVLADELGERAAAFQANAEVFAQQHVDDVRKALPGFITHPMPVTQAAAAVIDGIQRRFPQVTAPAGRRPCSPSAESQPCLWTNSPCSIPP